MISDKFTILTSWSRIKLKEREEVEFQLYAKQLPSISHAEERKQLLATIFACPSMHPFQGQLDHWNPVAAQWDPLVGLQPAPQQPAQLSSSGADQRQALAKAYRISAGKSTVKLLTEKLEEYDQKTRDEQNTPKNRWYWRKRQAAMDLIFNEKSSEIPAKIFISYRFEIPEVYTALERLLPGCRLETGQDPMGQNGQSDPFRDVIKKRISDSSGFIGIWKSKGDAQGDLESPWLLWELSIATAFDLPILLFVHRDFPDKFPRAILPEQHHVAFTDLDFNDIAAKHLDTFKARIKKIEEARYARNGSSLNRFETYN